MKCPVCFVEMECRSPIKGAMADYHCFNDTCDSRKTNYRPHIGIVLSKGKAPARCVSYHLPFKETWEENWFVIEGNELNKETTLFERSSFLMSDKEFIEDAQLAGPEKVDTIWEMARIVSINKFLRFPITSLTHLKAKDTFKIMSYLDIYEDYSYNYSYNKDNSGYGNPTYYHYKDKEKELEIPTLTPGKLGEISNIMNIIKKEPVKEPVKETVASAAAELGYCGFWE